MHSFILITFVLITANYMFCNCSNHIDISGPDCAYVRYTVKAKVNIHDGHRACDEPSECDIWLRLMVAVNISNGPTYTPWKCLLEQHSDTGDSDESSYFVAAFDFRKSDLPRDIKLLFSVFDDDNHVQKWNDYLPSSSGIFTATSTVVSPTLHVTDTTNTVGNNRVTYIIEPQCVSERLAEDNKCNCPFTNDVQWAIMDSNKNMMYYEAVGIGTCDKMAKRWWWITDQLHRFKSEYRFGFGGYGMGVLGEQIAELYSYIDSALA